jgi:hypothetical protein
LTVMDLQNVRYQDDPWVLLGNLNSNR